MGEAHALMLADDKKSLMGFGYNRYHQASIFPPSASPSEVGLDPANIQETEILKNDLNIRSTFVHPLRAARAPARLFGWEQVLAVAAGGGKSAILSVNHPGRSLRERCEVELLSQVSERTCVSLLEAAISVSGQTLARGCLVFLSKYGLQKLAISEAEWSAESTALPQIKDASLAERLARLQGLVNEAHALLSG
ncbi:hypothetical protein T492DRAFT_183499 [Pavlovales sp. CCMP2436]|nr:hypothetical protein T492DRAFT_183499 [Pavlovales sp. CCMP2436]